jgi:hypothetical protein
MAGPMPISGCLGLRQPDNDTDNDK